jgi:hypothetical protein
LTSPVGDGKGQPSLVLNQYGVGVDCHSGFFQICALIPNGREYRKLEQKVLARWNELRAAQAWVLRALREQGIEVAPGELRYTCESTGLYHMPLCLAWKGHPSVINPSDTSHIVRGLAEPVELPGLPCRGDGVQRGSRSDPPGQRIEHIATDR